MPSNTPALNCYLDIDQPNDYLLLKDILSRGKKKKKILVQTSPNSLTVDCPNHLSKS